MKYTQGSPNSNYFKREQRLRKPSQEIFKHRIDSRQAWACQEAGAGPCDVLRPARAQSGTGGVGDGLAWWKHLRFVSSKTSTSASPSQPGPRETQCRFSRALLQLLHFSPTPQPRRPQLSLRHLHEPPRSPPCVPACRLFPLLPPHRCRSDLRPTEV